VEERAGHRLSVEGLVRDPVFGLLDDRLLAGRLLAVAFDRDDVGRVQRAHHVEVLALPAELDELGGNGTNAHGDLRWVECVTTQSRRASSRSDRSDANARTRSRFARNVRNE